MAKYITTTLPYVNADPHIGFATEIVQADVLARAWRAQGEDVFFTTGTDEHGQKISQKAEEEGKEVQAYVDHFASEFKKLHEVLDLSNDAFIRTTDPKHVAAAQELWRRCEAAGDIYKKKYIGLYCVGDEAFVKESDLVEGKCPNHPTMDLVEIEEENYFFRFSKYQEALRSYLSKEGVIVPEWRRQEAIRFVEAGLEDFSISREAARMSWGVPVPGDESQVMYVWFDALTNYISTLGWPQDAEGAFKKFWEEGDTLQVAGKDQVRFQSLIWQAMLMSANLPTSDSVFYHGFITSGGQKMSKSLGNVISPYELVKKYGTDATRYLLLRHVHPTEDSDVTWERLDEWYTANLVNGLGNLVSRVMKLSETYSTEQVTMINDFSSLRRVDAFEIHTLGALDSLAGLHISFGEAIDSFEFNKAMNIIWALIQELDERITKDEPFKIVKIDQEKGVALIKELAREVFKIGVLLMPFMPATSEAILAAVRANTKPENLFPRLG